ncbi:MAG: Na/Pi cotransporter family protein [Armatimonadetes bacterium]|nr:MAG: Na/Pi cotransporter family protein [Armatimonadota bacterium]
MEEERLAPRYLDNDVITIPDVALEGVRREMERMARRVRLMLDEAYAAVTEGPQERIDSLRDLDDELDGLYDHTITYLAKVGQETLTIDQENKLRRLIGVANNLESLGDLIETEIAALAQRRLDEGLTISPASLEVLAGLHDTVAGATTDVLDAFSLDDSKRAADVRSLKAEVRELEESALSHYTARLTAPEPDRTELYRLETDLVEVYRRMFGMARRIAAQVVENGADD